METKIRFAHIPAGFAVSAAVFLAMGIPTALVPTGLYMRMAPPMPLDYALLAMTSALAGAYVSYSLYLKTAKSAKSTCAALGGTAAGFLSFGCLVCNALLVSIFGSAALTVAVEPYRHYFGLLAIALFAAAFYLKMRGHRNK